MGTTSTSPSSSSSSSSSLSSITSPLYFTGVSTYSSDFQSIIQRAVQIADIPVTSLQNQQTTVTNEQQALTALEPSVTALGNDVTALGTLASTQGLSASSSDSSTVSVVNTGATSPSTYTVSDITSLATAASETSLEGYSATQAVSQNGYVNLVVGSNTYQLNLTGSGQNNIGGLADAINNANAGVTATVLTAGSTEYLAVSANNTGATTLQLNDMPSASQTPVDLISNTGTGTETSLQSYSDPTSEAVSSTGNIQMVVGSQTYSLNVSGSNNNLNGLAQAINNADAGVTATVTGSTDDYSLTLTGASGTSMALYDENPLISDTNQGSNASFSLNGIPITESTNNISDVIPGVNFTLLNKTSGSVTLSLAPDPSQLSSALQTFVTDYNTLVSQVQAQEGQNAGPLQGDLIINEISSAMQDLVTYWNPATTSTIHSLSDLGVTFSDTGQLSFNADTFNALSDNQISDAFTFLGSANTGFAALASNFTQLSDPMTGMIESQINGYETENNSLSNQITAAQDYANQIQQSTTTQMEAADALVAELEQQQNTVDASIQSVNYVLYGRQVNANGM